LVIFSKFNPVCAQLLSIIVLSSRAFYSEFLYAAAFLMLVGYRDVHVHKHLICTILKVFALNVYNTITVAFAEYKVFFNKRKITVFT